MYINQVSGISRSYHWEEEVVYCLVVEAFWLGDAVVIFGRQQAGEGGV